MGIVMRKREEMVRLKMHSIDNQTMSFRVALNLVSLHCLVNVMRFLHLFIYRINDEISN